MFTYVLYEVQDMQTNRKQHVLAKDVVEAAEYITAHDGPRLRGYTRITTIELSEPAEIEEVNA